MASLIAFPVAMGGNLKASDATKLLESAIEVSKNNGWHNTITINALTELLVSQTKGERLEIKKGKTRGIAHRPSEPTNR